MPPKRRSLRLALARQQLRHGRMAAKPVPDDTDLEKAQQLLLVAQGHPEFAGGELLARR